MADLSALPLLLPQGADLSYAYTQQLQFTQLLGVVFVYAPEAPFYEIPLTIFGALSTDATAGNRSAILETFDQNDQFVYKIPAAAAQPPSSIYQYTWGIDFAAFSTNSLQTSCAPIPFVPLLPGWHMEIGVGGNGASDLWTTIPYMSVLRVPSGTVAAPFTPTVAPTQPQILV